MASSYGKGSYGNRLYSLAPTVDFSGNLTPVIGLSGTFDVLIVKGDLAGNLRPVIALSGSLTADRALVGDMAPRIVLAASAVVGPYSYWSPSEPCASPPWVSSELCPTSLWTPVGPCASVDWKESVDG